MSNNIKFSEVAGVLNDLNTKLASENGARVLEDLKKLLRGEFVETKDSSIIRVDRTIKPSYPDWVKEVLHPDLEAQGPAEYSAESIDQWFLEAQKTGIVTGNQIYAKLQENDNQLLKTCLGLRDLEEIQKKGIAFFRKYFKGKAVFGWSSVVRDRDGSLYVPSLCEDGDQVSLRWYWVDDAWDSSDPALRHAS